MYEHFLNSEFRSGQGYLKIIVLIIILHSFNFYNIGKNVNKTHAHSSCFTTLLHIKSITGKNLLGSCMFMFYCHSFIHQKHIYKKYRSGKCIVNISKKNSSSENRGLAHNLRLSHIMRLSLFRFM